MEGRFFVMKCSHILSPMMLYYMACYAVTGVYQSYSSLYFASQGFDHAAVGLLQAAAPMVAIAAQPAWGYAADRSPDRRWVLRGLIVASALAVAAYPFERSFALLVMGVCLFALFQTSLQPISDSIVLDALNAQGKPFGPIRVGGTLAFALVTLISGRIFESWGSWMPWVTALALLVSLAASFTLPKQPPAEDQRFPNPFVLFKDKQLMVLLSFVALLQITMGFFFSFYPVYFTQQLGASRQLLGWAYFIGSMSEVPFLLAADRLFERFGAGKLLCVSAAFMALRWMLLALLPSPVWAVATQLLQGGGFIVMMFAMAKYIALNVPEKLRSSGQTLLGMISYGFARVVGALAGGLLSRLWGLQILFGASAALAALSLATLGCYAWKKKL